MSHVPVRVRLGDALRIARRNARQKRDREKCRKYYMNRKMRRGEDRD